MSSINLMWIADGNIDSYNIYRSTSPMNIASLPPALATGVTTKSYSDASIIPGTVYYYRVSSIKFGIEKVSSEISVLAGIAWTPSNLTNAAKIWVDTDSNKVLSGNLVSSISNKGSIGGVFAQTTDTYKPQFVNANGYDGLVFYEDDLLSLNNTGALSFANNVPSSWVFAVISNVSARLSNNANIIFSSPDQNSNPRVELNAGYGTSSPVSRSPYGYASRTATGPWKDIKASTEVARGLLYTQFDFSAGLFKFKLSGNTFISQAYSSPGNTQATNSSSQGMGIGGTAYSTLHRFNGTLHAIIAGSGALPTFDEVQRLEGWAAHKYGFTNDLPSDHPYKLLTPIL